LPLLFCKTRCFLVVLDDEKGRVKIVLKSLEAELASMDISEAKLLKRYNKWRSLDRKRKLQEKGQLKKDPLTQGEIEQMESYKDSKKEHGARTKDASIKNVTINLLDDSGSSSDSELVEPDSNDDESIPRTPRPSHLQYLWKDDPYDTNVPQKSPACGLVNLNATCYMNFLLQLFFFASPLLRHDIQQSKTANRVYTNLDSVQQCLGSST
jgi:hypothetical protein